MGCVFFAFAVEPIKIAAIFANTGIAAADKIRICPTKKHSVLRGSAKTGSWSCSIRWIV
jgi:hypothetical protein